MEIVYFLLILWGVDSVIDEAPPPPVIIESASKSEAPIKPIEKYLKTGEFYKHDFGYYVANLVIVKCERKTILIADLTKTEDDVIKVNEVEMGCKNV